MRIQLTFSCITALLPNGCIGLRNLGRSIRGYHFRSRRANSSPLLGLLPQRLYIDLSRDAPTLFIWLPLSAEGLNIILEIKGPTTGDFPGDLFGKDI
jgi:hypothetical protein